MSIPGIVKRKDSAIRSRNLALRLNSAQKKDVTKLKSRQKSHRFRANANKIQHSRPCSSCDKIIRNNLSDHQTLMPQLSEELSLARVPFCVGRGWTPAFCRQLRGSGKLSWSSKSSYQS